MKTLSRDDQLKYTDVEGMTVVTNNRCVAQQIKSDKVENVVTGGSKKLENWEKLAKHKFCVEGINPAPHIHEQMATSNYVQMAMTLRTTLRITTSCLSTMR